MNVVVHLVFSANFSYKRILSVHFGIFGGNRLPKLKHI